MCVCVCVRCVCVYLHVGSEPQTPHDSNGTFLMHIAAYCSIAAWALSVHIRARTAISAVWTLQVWSSLCMFQSLSFCKRHAEEISSWLGISTSPTTRTSSAAWCNLANIPESSLTPWHFWRRLATSWTKRTTTSMWSIQQQVTVLKLVSASLQRTSTLQGSYAVLPAFGMVDTASLVCWDMEMLLSCEILAEFALPSTTQMMSSLWCAAKHLWSRRCSTSMGTTCIHCHQDKHCASRGVELGRWIRSWRFGRKKHGGVVRLIDVNKKNKNGQKGDPDRSSL